MSWIRFHVCRLRQPSRFGDEVYGWNAQAEERGLDEGYFDHENDSHSTMRLSKLL